MSQPDLMVLPAAERFMRHMVRFSGKPDGGFRLLLTSGGCAGYRSQFSIEPEPLDGDIELSINGLRLFLPVDTRRLLEGVTVDYIDTSLYSGLSFSNPNAGSCICSSASAEGSTPEPGVALSSIKRL